MREIKALISPARTKAEASSELNRMADLYVVSTAARCHEVHIAGFLTMGCSRPRT
jgi:hypothetical protein